MGGLKMGGISMRALSRVLLLGPVLLLVSGAAHALCQAPATAGSIEFFLEAPQTLLVNHPRGGLPMAYQVHSWATTNPATLKALVSVIARANPAQKQAIGQGMARAAASCSARNADIARRIQDAMRLQGDPEVTRAYTRFLSNDAAREAPSLGNRTQEPEKRRSLNPSLELNDPHRPITLSDPFRPR